MDESETMASFRKVDLVLETSNWLKGRILGGDWPVGTELPSEGELLRRLGVSRNVMREAMRNVRSLGLVEVSQGRRAVVKRMTAEAAAVSLEALLTGNAESLLFLNEARQALELETAALAAKRGTSEGLAGLSAALERLEHAAGQDAWIQADLEFHEALAVCAGNPVFVLLLGSVAALLRKQMAAKIGGVDMAESNAQHRALYVAVSQGDAAAARELMREHLAAAERHLAAAISSNPKIAQKV